MSERGVRGVRTVGGFRASRRAREAEHLEDSTQWGDAPPEAQSRPANGTTVTDHPPGSGQAEDTRAEPYVVVTEGVTTVEVPATAPTPMHVSSRP